MLSRLAVVLVTFGAMGCISLRDATLISTQVSLETFNAPVKCGPVGFRRVPLESRFGEYVRVTVSAPVSLKGTAFIHADGVAQEPREWVSSAESPLVIEARFENGDPDKLVALNSDRPIDITITGLEASEGGSCEGAVFTLEHGRLVAPVDDRAWLSELERRGGPELLARREAARQLEEERRLAHYAEWKAQSATDDELAMMDSRRLAHYAAWEAERHPVEVDATETAVAAAEEWNEFAPGQVVGQTAVTAATCASGVCEAGVVPSTEVFVNTSAASPGTATTACATGSCGGESAAVGFDVSANSAGAACATGSCRGEANSVGAACATGSCGGESASVGFDVSANSAGAACATGSCGAATSPGAAMVETTTAACATGSCGGAVSASCPGGTCDASAWAGFNSGAAAGGTVACPTPGAVPSPSSGGGGNVAAGGVAGRAEEWVLPPTTDVNWQQPYDTVAVETRVAVPERERLRPGLIPVPPPGPCASCGAAEVEFDVGFIPSMFGLIFSAPPPTVSRPAQPAHGAVPVSPPATRR